MSTPGLTLQEPDIGKLGQLVNKLGFLLLAPVVIHDDNDDDLPDPYILLHSIMPPASTGPAAASTVTTALAPPLAPPLIAPAVAVFETAGGPGAKSILNSRTPSPKPLPATVEFASPEKREWAAEQFDF